MNAKTNMTMIDAVQLIPNELYQKLEFDKILTLLSQNCVGALGQEAAQNLVVSSDLATIDRWLKEVDE